MSGVEAMIREAEKSLGVAGRPNEVTRPYSSRNGSYFATAPWCDMAITEWSRRSGNYGAVCFGLDYAYTVWHAQRFQKAGRWTTDTSGIRRGDVLFFDWDGSNSVGRIDHVGIVTSVKGGAVYTIEGNTGDRCARRVRYASTIVGYGRPDYSGSSSSSTEDDMIGLSKGDKGEKVKYLQVMLTLAGQKLPKYGVDGDYGNETVAAVKKARAVMGSNEGGDRITGWAAAQIQGAAMRKQGK